MIYYNPEKWFSLIFQFHRSDTFRILLPAMLAAGVYTAGITYPGLEVWQWKSGTTAVHSLLGVVPGLLLVFRTNTACERIKNTPIPYSCSIFMKKFIFIFTMSMPRGFITTFACRKIPVVMFVFYVLVSLELIAEEIEDPFGKDANDLPMDEIAARIRLNVRELMLQKEPEAVANVF